MRVSIRVAEGGFGAFETGLSRPFEAFLAPPREVAWLLL
jgi:hypothetical protein